jgi:cytoskeletal protein CcmA (bactofilin family)
MQKSTFKKRGWIITILVTMVLTLTLAGTVSAAEFPPDGTIPVGKVIDDDVFLGATDVVMSGTVNGNLIAGGQTITINGMVNGDALLMAETVTIANGAVIEGNLFTSAANIFMDGKVNGSIFGASAAAEMKENAAIGRNLYFGGFSLTTKPSSVVGMDLLTGAYQAILSGSVARDARIGAGAIELNGSIGRNALFNVGHDKEVRDPEMWFSYNPGRRYFPPAIPAGIRISSTAKINGNLTFTSDTDQSSAFKPAASGSVIYQTPVPSESATLRQSRMERSRGAFQGFSFFQVLQRFLTLLILGALVIWLLFKPFNRVVDAGYRNPVHAAGWGFVVIAVGFLAMLVIPLVFVLVAILLGFVSLGGLLFAWLGVVGTAILLAVLAFLFVVFTVSKLVALYLAARWLTAHLFPKSAGNAWIILLVGVLAYALLSIIPILGILAGLAAALVGTGAIWLSLPSFGRKPKRVAAK